LLACSGLIFPAARVVVAIATEIINAGMIWRRLFAFIQLFKPSAPRRVAGIMAVGATLASLFAKCGWSKATDIANEHLGSPGLKVRIFTGWGTGSSFQNVSAVRRRTERPARSSLGCRTGRKLEVRVPPNSL